MNLYPLKFKPVLKERIWGGNKLTTLFNKSASEEKIGESWELCGFPEEDSVVSNGYLAGNTITELIEVYMGELVGDAVYDNYGLNFPLLFKIIDAQDKLSIQVHPDDEVAAERHNSFGKTEMWYVLEAEENAELIAGFNQECTKEKYNDSLKNNSVEDLLQKISVKKGDVIYIPAGLVHAIGKGILLAEIQQSSDVTYRIYDYNRKDDKGNHRQLHIEEALDVINFDSKENPIISYEKKLNEIVELYSCDYFTTNYISFDSEVVRNYGDIDSFKVYMCTEGFFNILSDGNYTPVNIGETVLIPASMSEVVFIPDGKATVLEVFAGKIDLKK